MKRLLLLGMAFCALAVAVPAAETAPTSDTGCTEQHVSGAECQGPDVDPAANSCAINTWVDNATCELTVPDGVASGGTGAATAYAEDQDGTWHAELRYVIRDISTGQILFEHDSSETVPITEQPVVPAASFGFGTTFSQEGGANVLCEVTGTHNPAGAATSAAAATTGHGVFNNSFQCTVN